MTRVSSPKGKRALMLIEGIVAKFLSGPCGDHPC